LCAIDWQNALEKSCITNGKFLTSAKKKGRKNKKQGGKTPLSVFELEPHGAGVCLWLIYDSVDK